jgi:sigma-E factor negative regulatory protein RseC
MSGKEVISHPGIVDKIEGDRIFVRILAQSACSTCHAKGACIASEMEEKIVDVARPEGRFIRNGDQVQLVLRKSLGNLAVILGYIVPFVILLAALLITVIITGKEGLAALVSLLILVPYYLVLYLFKGRLEKVFTFMIE